MNKKTSFVHPRYLSTERNKIPPLPEIGDEIYCGGAIYFNISAMLEWLTNHPLPIADVPVHIWGSFADKDDRHVEAADITRPIIIAEIAPDYRDFIPDIPESDWLTRGYVCIDGQHRIEKARRLGMETLPAVVMRMEQHVPFVYKSYDRYVEYWNGKFKNRTEDAQRWKRNHKI